MMTAVQGVEVPTRPLRRSEYDRLVAAGVFSEEKLELLFGHLVTMGPQGIAHSFAVQKLFRLLHSAIGSRAMAWSQAPLALSDESEPEPDVAIVPNDPDEYARHQPNGALLVIEVADSSLAKDRRLKARLYAEAGVPEY